MLAFDNMGGEIVAQQYYATGSSGEWGGEA